MRRTLVALAALMSSACTTLSEPAGERLTFTDGLAQQYQLGRQDLNRLQYYVSDTIRLARSHSQQQMGIREGRLVDAGSRTVDELIVDRGTPGVVLASGPDWMAVSFEEGSYLYFVSSQSRYAWLGQHYQPGAYYLYSPDWNGREGTVRVGNEAFTAIEGSGQAYLMVDRDSFYAAQGSQRVQPGRLLGQ